MHRQCGPRCQKYDASRLQQCLHKAVLSSNVNLIEETLEDIAGLAFLASDLRASSICREVGKLRKHSDSKIKERAIFIIKRWKKIFECEKSAPTSPVPYTADQSSSTSTSSPTSSSRTTGGVGRTPTPAGSGPSAAEPRQPRTPSGVLDRRTPTTPNPGRGRRVPRLGFQGWNLVICPLPHRESELGSGFTPARLVILPIYYLSPVPTRETSELCFRFPW